MHAKGFVGSTIGEVSHLCGGCRGFSVGDVAGCSGHNPIELMASHGIPRLSRGNPGIQELKDWLKAQREAGRDALETASGDRIVHLQGRLS